MADDVPVADRLDEVISGVFRWEVHSPQHKVGLTSHARLRGDELTVIDPIGLRDDLREQLLERSRSAAVFVTSENHLRAASEWRASGVPIVSRRASGFAEDEANALADSLREWRGFEVIALDGGPAGECVLFDAPAGLAFGGDALVNLPVRGLEVLPEKYCRDQALLRKSLLQVAQREIECLFPAHGDPITPRASELVRELLSAGGDASVTAAPPGDTNPRATR